MFWSAYNKYNTFVFTGRGGGPSAQIIAFSQITITFSKISKLHIFFLFLSVFVVPYFSLLSLFRQFFTYIVKQGTNCLNEIKV